MIDVVLLGNGNVALNLYSAFIAHPEINLKAVYARNRDRAAQFSEVFVTQNLNELPAAQLYLMAVSDDAITALSKSLPLENQLVVHTSGSVPMHAIATKHRAGVFYPIQTFNKHEIQGFTGVPLALEAQEDADLALLNTLGTLLNGNTFTLSSEQRKYVHLAAVFVNNFVNQLYGTAQEILEHKQIPFDVLKPLIAKTATVIQNQDPKTVQTGPAKRNDQGVINNHLAMLDPQHKELYTLFTAAIQNTFNKDYEL